jgi:hypothetical protein
MNTQNKIIAQVKNGESVQEGSIVKATNFLTKKSTIETVMLVNRYGQIVTNESGFNSPWHPENLELLSF